MARADELPGALGMVLSGPAGAADAGAVAEFMTFARDRGIDLSAVHVAARGPRTVAALLPVISPGRTMLVLAPGAPGRAAETGVRALVPAVCRYGRGEGVHLAQCLIDPQDAALERVFTQEGFFRMAELLYLHVAPPAGAAPPPLPPGLNWVTYSSATHERFGRTILDSYQGSLDCPALNGLRSMDDIVAGHKASGIFDPATWFLLEEAGKDLGVLLLSQGLRSDALELVYVGLLPAARGRRFGELMVRQTLAVAARQNLARLCLAVDARNTPALKLYYRHGMQRIGSKVALLRDLRRDGIGQGVHGAPHSGHQSC